MTKRWFGYGLLAVFASQFLLVGGMLFDRLQTLRNGQEVILSSRFVDPRDLFRGHYVILNLSVGDVMVSLPGGNRDYGYNDPIFVGLKEQEDGFWEAAQLADSAEKITGMPVLKATYRGKSGDRLRISLPFDRYFAPKKRAQELEKFRQDSKLGVVIALNEEGGGVIKGVTIDGEIVYDEPLL